jgi:hypothetical protein
MNVVAVSTPNEPDWRWRIVDYHGETVEESHSSLPTIAHAVAEGTELYDLILIAILPSGARSGAARAADALPR